MTDTVTVKLEWTDICRHEPMCERGRMFYHTVPDYRTYSKATHWLREERGYKFISVEGETEEHSQGWRYTGRYTFRFLCEQEYNWFVLRWS